MGKSVYIVSVRECDLYRILAAFSKKSRAEAYAELARLAIDHTVDVEEYTLDEPRGEWVKTVVRMSVNGDVQDVWLKLDGETGFLYWDNYGNLVWAVATVDEKRAIKGVNEKRIQLLANNMWGKEV